MIIDAGENRNRDALAEHEEARRGLDALFAMRRAEAVTKARQHSG